MDFFNVIASTLTYSVPLGVLVLILFFICYIYNIGRTADREILATYGKDRQRLLNAQQQMYEGIIDTMTKTPTKD